MSARDDLRAAIPPQRAAREKPSTTKYAKVDQVVAEILGEDTARVYTASISKPGNVTVRAKQSDRAVRSRFLVLVVEDADKPGMVDGTIDASRQFVGPGQKRAVLIVTESIAGANDWDVAAVVEPAGGPILPMLVAVWPSASRHEPAPSRSVGPGAMLAVPLAMDDRTTRMARLAIASSPAVMFVGPPGTGKNRLLAEILAEIEADPQSYGFTKARQTVIEPAEEGWTTRDLVGGETVDENGVLRFRPGRVLDAIAHDRWLVIDEANRADLDRIFGGLLTWLSRQQVVVGRASTKLDAPLIRLGWSDEPSSTASGTDRLTADDAGSDPIDYVAGTEFRLLGTYNALDAQRVFRFGLALGRRFAQVPVPPASLDDFLMMLEPTLEEIHDDTVRTHVRETVAGLYRVHLGTIGAQLGPGLFLSIPEYVAKGIALASLVDVDPTDSGHVAALIVEGYVLSTGSWLARLDEHTELAALGASITTPSTDLNGQVVPPLLSGEQWTWVVGQLPTIGG